MSQEVIARYSRSTVLVKNEHGRCKLSESGGAISPLQAEIVYTSLCDIFPLSLVSYSWREKSVIGGRVNVLKHNGLEVWVGLDAPYRGEIMWGQTPWLTPVEMGEFAGMLEKALELSEEVA